MSASSPDDQVLYDFESGPQGWSPCAEGDSCRATQIKNNGEGTVLQIERGKESSRDSASGQNGTGACVDLPDSKGHWHPATHVAFRTFVPQQAPDNVQTIVSIKDAELNYYQHLHQQPLEPGSWNTIRIDLTADSNMWSYRGHYKPWDGYCRQKVQELGIKFQTDARYPGPFYVDDIRLETDPTARPKTNAIYNLRANTLEVDRYGKFELSFNLGRTYSNPFDPDVVRITGHFTRPDGSEVSVPGFFYQGYRRRMSKRTEQLIPQGRSHWKVRFAPMQTGKYSYYVTITDRSSGKTETLRSDTGQFRCIKSNRAGFVRISDEDKFHFETDDGSFYYPIGHNIAAVHDARAKALQVNIPASEGTFAYDRILSRMGEAGENWGRIWMSPWSFGLEWTHAYNCHYNGRGRYNLQNAWKLDHVLRQADKNGIRVLLLFTAHGEIGDYESDFWGHDPKKQQGHPYWSKYGGPAESPRQLYTSDRAVELYHQKLRYIVARWGYSTAVMAWEIINEADLAHFYRNKKFGQIGAEFVASAARHIRKLDPANHLITSSVFRYRKSWSQPVLALDELDFNTGHVFKSDLSKALQRDTRYMHRKYDKIFFVTEAGLTPFAQDAETTSLAIHRTLWSSFMIPSAGVAAPWWWVLIDQRDLYSHFHALSEYAEGVDRRNKNFIVGAGTIKGNAKTDRELDVSVLTNGKRAFCWVANRAAFSTRAKWEAAAKKPAKLCVYGLKRGNYRIEMWDTYSGKIIHTVSGKSKARKNSDHETAITFPLKPFARDIAVKIKPQQD